jgi:hypothetical protein
MAAERLIRFIVMQRDEDSLVEKGIIMAAAELEEAVSTSDADRKVIRKTFDWFNRNLPVPHRLARSRRANAHDKAISWFKPSAIECIERMSILIEVLKRNGVLVKSIQTSRPGYVVYEDAQQVVAEPFRREYKRRVSGM